MILFLLDIFFCATYFVYTYIFFKVFFGKPPNTMTTYIIPKKYKSLDSEMISDELTVNGWLRQHIQCNAIQVIIGLIIEFVRYMDTFDEEFVGKYVELSPDKTIVKHDGPLSHPISFITDKLWTFTTSILSDGIFFRLFQVKNVCTSNNINRLSIGIACIKSVGKQYSQIYPAGLKYKQCKDSSQTEIKCNLLILIFCQASRESTICGQSILV